MGFFGWLSWAIPRQLKKTLASLAALRCPACGAPFDEAKAAAAHELAMAEKQRQHEQARADGVLLRISPQWSFPCPACGAALVFDPDALAFRSG